jgi:hypothetical protein
MILGQHASSQFPNFAYISAMNTNIPKLRTRRNKGTSVPISSLPNLRDSRYRRSTIRTVHAWKTHVLNNRMADTAADDVVIVPLSVRQ